MTRAPAESSLLLPTIVIGIGLSGFWDGILLHQVLQWHHLLSLVPGEIYDDISTQILADGLFHVLMYIVTAAGLLMLWRRRAALGRSSWKYVAGGGLLGFGLWNVIDVAFFHWILGIHRIRVGVENPMVYDLAWLAGLGLVPLAAGLALMRRSPPARPGGGTRAGATLALFAVVAASLGAVPSPASTSTLVFMAEGRSAGVLNSAIAANGRLLWMDPQGRAMLIAGNVGSSEALYRSGAIFVTRSPAFGGCAVSAA